MSWIPSSGGSVCVYVCMCGCIWIKKARDNKQVSTCARLNMNALTCVLLSGTTNHQRRHQDTCTHTTEHTGSLSKHIHTEDTTNRLDTGSWVWGEERQIAVVAGNPFLVDPSFHQNINTDKETSSKSKTHSGATNLLSAQLQRPQCIWIWKKRQEITNKYQHVRV